MKQTEVYAMKKSAVSVILPAYNEGMALQRNVKRLEGMLERLLVDFEIIISEDGSTDGTGEIAKRLEGDRIKVLRNGTRLGKGAAIKRAAGHSRGDIVIFMDADLASNPAHVRELVRLMEGGADMVIGSRYLKESKASRSAIRFIASKSFNWLVRHILGSRLSDHQCGFKAFRKDMVLPVIDEVEDERWFWDTELLVRAQKKGLRIEEIPIEWKEAGTSRFRLLRDTANMGLSLARFRLRNI
jgi:glycosyltransferase involved in cell wall biosynthesis